MVSVGSTPTAVHAHSLAGVSEMRPGVYMFNDLDQLALGSCRPDDLALSVLTSVIGQYPERDLALIDAGALALSKDVSAGEFMPDAGFGTVADLARALVPDVVVVVADAGLGTIHAVRSTLLALAGVPGAVRLHLNRYDPDDDLHRRNRRWLIERDGLDPTTDVAGLADAVTVGR